MKKTIQNLSLLSLIPILTACGGGGSDSDVVTSAFEGTWSNETGCEVDSVTFDGVTTIYGSYKDILTITGDSAVFDFYEYETNNCSGESVNGKGTMNLTFGDTVDDASSICSNAQEVNAELVSIELEGTVYSGELLESFIEENDGDTPSLASFGLLCTSDDGKRIYAGDTDDESNSGQTEETRPTTIDDEFYLVKQ